MPKIYKRILTPLFFAVVALVVLCCSALADDISGVPTVSINGATPVPFTSNLNFESEDEVSFVTSGIISFDVIVPADVVFNFNPSVSIIAQKITVNGIVNVYGDLIRSSGSSSGTPFFVLNSGSTLNLYYGSIVKSNLGNGVDINQGGTLNVYNGLIDGVYYGVNNYSSSSVVNVYSGEITGGTSPFNQISYVNFINSSYDVVDDTVVARNNVFSSITSFVSSSVSWIGSFISSITSSPILLVFILFGFVGFGIGLLRRVKSI